MTARQKTKVSRQVDPAKLRGAGVEAGVMVGSSAGEGSASLVEIAVWNEFGTEKKSGGKKKEHIPPRPFIRSTADNQRRKWKKTVARLARLVLRGGLSSSKAESILGAMLQSDIQDTIIELRTPPNADSTIAAKGSDNPLVDDGTLRDSVKWVKYDG